MMISLFDKIRFRLQDHCESGDCRKFCHECDFKTALRIVDEVEAECMKNIMDELLEAKRDCGEDSDCSQCIFGCEDGCRLQDLQITGGNNGWIPCSERLPEDNTRVLACFSSGTVTELAYLGEGMFRGLYEYTTKVIIAWMPLPEPYNPEKGAQDGNGD